MKYGLHFYKTSRSYRYSTTPCSQQLCCLQHRFHAIYYFYINSKSILIFTATRLLVTFLAGITSFIVKATPFFMSPVFELFLLFHQLVTICIRMTATVMVATSLFRPFSEFSRLLYLKFAFKFSFQPLTLWPGFLQ